MKIALIGPGIIPIPPPGWGAVEILIYDYYLALKELKHEVDIINPIRKNNNESSTPNCKYIKDFIQTINKGKYDIVHFHYDVHFHMLDKIKAKKICITSHYPYIDQIHKHKNDGYDKIFNFLVANSKYYHFVLADKDIKVLLEKGAKKEFIFKLKNGIKCNQFNFYQQPKNKEKSIYLGKIDERKKQYKYQSINNIDFVGPYSNSKFDKNLSNYLGEWNREEIYKNLGNYCNLILLSTGEADPLVIKEALVSGLGIVTNQTSGENLNKNKPFIDIIPEDKLDDLKYIENILEKNRETSLKMREEIKDYGREMFDIKKQVENYFFQKM